MQRFNTYFITVLKILVSTYVCLLFMREYLGKLGSLEVVGHAADEELLLRFALKSVQNFTIRHKKMQNSSR